MTPESEMSSTGSRTERFADYAPTPTQGNLLLKRWLATGLILSEDWTQLSAAERESLEHCTDFQELLARLVEHRLLTEYQASRIRAGKTFGLILGNFRVLSRLGAGGMGIVYKAEHIVMRRLVAIKVLSCLGDDDLQLLARFRAEMRAVAQLQHPNIVSAFDAGTLHSPEEAGPTLHYFVMEYVQGRNLEEMVEKDGPLSVTQACDLTYQLATALAEAHKQHLVHRDIKPANILVTPEGQAKLMDFGLSRHFRHRLTEPGTVLGTIDFMAPEQAADSSTVDIRADIYALGGTLYWCLTGQLPFEQRATIQEELLARLTQQPPSVRQVRPSVPAELDQVIAQMMACKPDDRYQTPQALMRALLPFLAAEGQETVAHRSLVEAAGPSQGHRVLVVDDEAGVRTMISLVLQTDQIACDEASGGQQALEAVRTKRYDLVLLDVDMPGMSGREVLAQLRENPPVSHLKVILMSGRVSADEMVQMLAAGADDYLAKPFSLVEVRARVQAALHLKDAQDRTEALNRQLLSLAAEQERALQARDSDLFHARNALVLSLAKLVEQRTSEHNAHLQRLQRYCRCLAEQASQVPAFRGQIDENFIQLLECSAPLHDIGKVALPEHVLLKPGKLTSEERLIMQTHTTIGADTLAEVARQHPFAQAFLQMAIDIVRHHHERWDGTGYPERLAGEAIPLAARIVALADTYDALRCRRTHRPALSHAAAVQLIVENTGQFDPNLVAVFQRCSDDLHAIFQAAPN